MLYLLFMGTKCCVHAAISLHVCICNIKSTSACLMLMNNGLLCACSHACIDSFPTIRVCSENKQYYSTSCMRNGLFCAVLPHFLTLRVCSGITILHWWYNGVVWQCDFRLDHVCMSSSHALCVSYEIILIIVRECMVQYYRCLSISIELLRTLVFGLLILKENMKVDCNNSLLYF